MTHIQAKGKQIAKSLTKLSCLLGACFLVSLTATAAEDLPYSAVVKDGTINVFSGPAEVHYVTDRLPIGEQVEVYRIDPQGWLAIRPPRGSFSLVPADALAKTEEPGIARVKYADVQAWVGTRLRSPTRPLWQVKLNKDELVEVIGEQPRGNDSTDAIRWMRIAPPAGEFRWVRQEGVTRFQPLDVSSHEGPSSAFSPDEIPRKIVVGNVEALPIDEEQQNSSNITLVSGEEENSEEKSSNPMNPVESDSGDSTKIADGVNAPREDKSAGNTSWPDGFVKRTADSNEVASQSENLSDEGARPTNQTFQASPTGLVDQPLSNDQLAQQIRLIEMQLTRMATYPTTQWDTAAFRRQAKELAAQSNSTSDQQRLSVLLAKLDQYDQLKTSRLALEQLRHEMLSPQPETAIENPVLDLALNEDDPKRAEQARQALETYEGTGFLNRLYTSNGVGRGGYVLQNEEGQVLRLVTPSPGVNLERYLNEKIAVQGKTTKHPKHTEPLIIADRVIVLDRHRK